MAETAHSYVDRESILAHKEIPQAKQHMIRLHDGLTFGQYMIAGSAAGVVEHVAMYPVDTLKTRLQMISSPCGSASAPVHNVSKAFVSVMKHEGPVGLYRGVGAMVLGAGPSHAVYFAVYEVCKRRFESDREGHQPFAHMAAGACATVASDAVFNPMDVVKQRLQLKSSPYLGVVDCVKRTLKEEGFKAFYASYKTTLLMNVPFTGVHFAAYEAAKKVLIDVTQEHSVEDLFLTHLVAGGTAGALASAVTTPLDVVKTRLQCQGVCGADRYGDSSMREVIKRIVAHEGTWSLFKGLRPRVLFHTPAAAISWSTYEAGKSFLQRWNAKQNELY